MLEKLYNNRYLALAAVAIEIYCEHLQAMSYMRDSTKPSGDNWNSDAKDAFDGLKKLALRLSDSNYMVLFVLSTVLIGLSFGLYIALADRLHAANKTAGSKLTPCIWLVEHVIFGIGFVPLIAQFAQTQFCNSSNNLKAKTDIDCFKTDQLTMMEFGFIFTGIALIIAGVILPVFKTERRGVEAGSANECYFPGLYKINIVGVVMLLSWIKLPEVGIYTTIALIVYLLVRVCYADPVVACLRSSVLFGQLWVFSAAVAADDDGSTASHMLYAWPAFLAVGAAAMAARVLLIKPRYKVNPIEKN